jgi:hypothetical protein
MTEAIRARKLGNGMIFPSQNIDVAMKKPRGKTPRLKQRA